MVLLALGALCQAAAVQWPEYAHALLTLSGILGGGAVVTSPGHLSPTAASRMSVAPPAPRKS